MKPRILLALLLVALCAGPLAAEQLPKDRCGDDETFIKCFNRFQQASPDQRVVTDNEVREKTANLNTKVAAKATSEGTPAAASSLRDTLSAFFSALDLGTVSNENETLTLKLNPEWLSIGPGNKLAGEVVLRDPQVSEPLLGMIPEEKRSTRKESLQGELGDFDDATYTLSYSRESGRFGRVFSMHRTLIDSLFSRALGATDTSERRTRTAVELLKAFPNILLDESKASLQKKNVELPPGYEDVLIAMAQSTRASLVAFQRFSAKNGLFLLGDLVNNQPQLMASVSFRKRDDLVGPDELKAEVSYEMGWANMNGLRRWLDDRKEVLSPPMLKNYLEARGWLADGNPTAALKNAPRLSFSLSYARREDYSVTLPDDNVSLAMDHSETISGSLGTGLYLKVDDMGKPVSRIDFKVMGEKVHGDPMRQDRLVATTSLSQTLTNGTTASLSLVWANKPEFLGEVDKELSARVGLKYSVDRKPAKP